MYFLKESVLLNYFDFFAQNKNPIRLRCNRILNLLDIYMILLFLILYISLVYNM